MFDSYDIYDRHTLTLHCLITLRSPLSHIGEVRGNVSNLKTVKLIDLEGNPRSCFVYSGNALRNGILRRRGTAAALSELGLTVNPDVHHTLFAGGRIDGSTANDMELDTKIRKLMPWLSVLGTAKPVGVFGSKKAQMIHGRIQVGSAYLVSYESAEIIYNEMPGLLPPSVLPRLKEYLSAKEAIASNPFEMPSEETIAAFEEAKKYHLPYLRKELGAWTEHLTIDQTTRRDSTTDPVLQKFLTSSNQLLEEGADLKNIQETRKVEMGQKKSNQMISADRLIMAMSKLYSRWSLNATQVEIGWVVDTLLKFGESPYIGGKNNRNNGLVALDFWFQKGSDRGHFMSIGDGQQQLSPQAEEPHKAYREYVSQYQTFLSEAKEQSETIRGLLDG